MWHILIHIKFLLAQQRNPIGHSNRVFTFMNSFCVRLLISLSPLVIPVMISMDNNAHILM